MFSDNDEPGSKEERKIGKHGVSFTPNTIQYTAKGDDAEKVKQNWEQIKLKEGNRSVLGGVPNSLPSLVKAYRMQEKFAKVSAGGPNPFVEPDGCFLEADIQEAMFKAQLAEDAAGK